MIAKYAGSCERCGGEIAKGETCGYNATTRKIQHYTCPQVELDDGSQLELAERLGFRPVSGLDLFLLPGASVDESERPDRPTRERNSIRAMQCGTEGEELKNGTESD